MHSTAHDATVGERDRKQKNSVLRARPGSLWRLHTRFDLIRTDSKRSGRRVGGDRWCRSPQLGFTTSQLRGCTPSSDSPSGGPSKLERRLGQPFGRTLEQPLGKNIEPTISLWGCTHTVSSIRQGF